MDKKKRDRIIQNIMLISRCAKEKPVKPSAQRTHQMALRMLSRKKGEAVN